MSSSRSSLPILWIIEYIAKFQQLPLSTVHDLIKRLLDLPYGRFEKNTREMVALRCLEGLFGPSNGITNEVLPESRIEFDYSETCEDVLQDILEELSLHRHAGPERLKWDIQFFLMYKRASMSRCTLEMLKDVTSANNHLDAFALKRKSESLLVDESNRKTGHLSDFGTDPGMCSPRGLDPLGMAIDDYLVRPEFIKDNKRQHGMFNELFPSTKRPKVALAAGNSGSSVSGHGDILHSDHCYPYVKTLKLDATAVGHLKPSATVHKLMPDMKDGFSDKSPESNYQNIHIKRLDHLSAGKAPEVGTRESGFEDLSDRGRLSHEDEFEKDYFNLPLKKESFLKSSCKSNQNLPGKENWTDKRLCVKCNDSGDPLLCSTNNCPVIVHRCCLSSAPTFDDKGHFYCPFCAYSSLISQYLEAKKKVSTARKEVANFSGMCFGPSVNELSEEPVKEPSHSSPTVKGNNPATTNVNEHFVDDEQNGIDETSLLRKVGVGLQMRSSPEGSSHDSVTSPGKLQMVTVLQGNEKVVGKCVSVEEAKMIQENILPDHTHDNVYPSVSNEVIVHDQGKVEGRTHEQNLLSDRKSSKKSVNNENLVQKQGEDEGRIYEQYLLPSSSESSDMPVCSVKNESYETSNSHSDKFEIYVYPRRTRNRQQQDTCPAAEQLRRNALKWTTEEEEILKKGVQTFVNAKTVRIPWSKILEYGAHVFQKDRTSTDLKDKWRNLCKGSASPWTKS